MSAKKTTGKTKKDLESKIAELEAKLEKLSSQLETKPTTQAPPPKPTTQAPPPKPQPAATSPRGSLPKGSQPPPQAQAQQSTSASTIATALETVYNNYPMTDTHSYKAKTTGYSPAPNRYFARRTAPRGTAPTQNWNLQKSKVPGYTQPSNLYFATRARLAYHPPTKTFTGYGLSLEGVATQAQSQQAPPPPPKPSTNRGTLPKGTGSSPQQVQQTGSSGGGKSKQDQLAEYEKEYLERIENERRQQAEIHRAAAELAEKRAAQSSSSKGSSRGTLPKGF